MKAISNYDKRMARAYDDDRGGDRLEPGAYCVRIEAVNDHSDAVTSPYIGIVFNVWDAETRQFRFPADEVADPEKQWRYELHIKLGNDRGLNKLAQLIKACEDTAENNGWQYLNIDGGEQQLVGKWVGLILHHELYVSKRGKYAGLVSGGKWLVIAKALPARDVLDGNYDPSLIETDRWAVDQYAKQHPGWVEVPADGSVGTAQPAAPSESDIPF